MGADGQKTNPAANGGPVLAAPGTTESGALSNPDAG